MRGIVEPVYNGRPWDHAEWLLNGGTVVEPVYYGRPWDHVEWMLKFNRGGLLIEVTRIV